MAKLFIYLTLAILLACLVSATANYDFTNDISTCVEGTASYAGSSLGDYQCVPSNYSSVTGSGLHSLNDYTVASPNRITNALYQAEESIQYAAATTHTFWYQDDMKFDRVKERQNLLIQYAWAYNIALIKVMIEMIKLLFDFFQMWIIAYIFMIQFPRAFINLRNRMATFILSRGTK